MDLSDKIAQLLDERKNHPEMSKGGMYIGKVELLLESLSMSLPIDGDVCELGCFQGFSSILIRKILNHVESQKIYHVYDSWEGLPDMTYDGKYFKKGSFKTSKDIFIKLFKSEKLIVPVIHSGWFKNIPDPEYPDKISFAFFDGDFYSSIMDSFDKVYSKMTPGGIIHIDDYDNPRLPGVRKACDEFLANKPEKAEYLGHNQARIIKK